MSLSSKVNYSLEALSGITVGNINITGNIFQNNNPYIASQWTSTSGNALSYTSGNVIISNGSLLVSALTTGNINFTGTLYQNGAPYVGSQWTTTTGNLLTYTSGNVLISNGTISASGATAGILYANNSRIGINTTSPLLDLDLLNGAFGIRSNSSHDHLYFIVNSTASAMRAGGADGGLYIDINGGASSGTYGSLSYTRVATFTSRGNVGIGNTSPSFNLDVTGTGQITTSLTTGALYSTNQTTTNIVATSSTITNLNVPGTLTVVNITSTNLVDTTISAGTLVGTSASVANLSASIGTISNMIVSSNTVSNSYISGGLGIGTVNPNTSYNLDVAGSIRSGLRIDIGGTQPIYNGNTLGRLFITGSQNSVTAGPNILITTAQDAFPTYNFLTYGHDSAWTMYDMYFDGGSFRNSATNTAFMMVKENSTLKWNYNITGFSAGAAATVTTSLCIGSGGNVGLGGQVTPAYTLDVSGGARIISGISAGSSTFTNVSAGDSQFSNLSTGNINFTGSLFQNGSAYIGSQWVGTSGSIYYGTAGSSTVGINTTSPGTTLDVSGTGRITTSLTTGALYSTNQTTTNIVATTISGGTFVGTNVSSTNISLTRNTAGITFYSGSTAVSKIFDTADLYIWSDDKIFLNVGGSSTAGTPRMFINSSGQVGIATTSPAFTLDVNGTVRASTSLTTGALYSTNQTSTNIVATNLSSSTLTLSSPTNATSVSNGGALTVVGGAAVGGDLIVGGSILYSNAAAASSTFAYLTLTASDWSTDIANGSLVVYGGISVQNTANAVSATEGNGLTIAGGAGIGADLYVGGKADIPNVISSNNTTTNIITSNISGGALNISTGITSNNIYLTGDINYGNLNNYINIPDNGFIRVGADQTYKTHMLVVGDNYTDAGGRIVYRFSRYTSWEYINGVSGSPQTRMTLVSSGNLGIGTTSPVTTLDVSGTGRITTSLTTGALYSTNQTTTNIVATSSTITNLNVPGTLTVVNITSTNLVETNITASSIIVTGGSLNATHNSNTIGNIFTTNGNVGIGTTSPSAKLTVNGPIMVSNPNETLGINAYWFGSNWTRPNSSSSGFVFDNNPTTTTLVRISSTGVSNNVITLNNDGSINVSATTNSPTFSGGSLFLSSGLTTPNAIITNANITNLSTSTLVGTTSSTANVYASLGTVSNLVGVNLSSSNLITTVATIPNVINTNITTTSIIVTGGSLNATFNSNTMGNIFTTGGNVGINTSAPVFALDVNGNFRVAVTSSTTSNTSTIHYVGNSYGSTAIRLQGHFNGTTQIGTDGLTGRSYLQYYNDLVINRTTQGMTTASVYIDSLTGDVGLNSTDPSYKLDVNGTVRISNSLTATFNSNTVGNIFTTGGNVGIGTTAPSSLLHLFSNASAVRLNLDAPLSANSGFSLRTGGVEKSVIWRPTNTDDFAIWMTGSNSNALYIKNTNGNVGINTTNPLFTLDVNGIIDASTYLTSGALYSTNQTTTNIVATTLSTGTLVGTTISISNVYSSLGTISNMVHTTLSSANAVLSASSASLILGSDTAALTPGINSSQLYIVGNRGSALNVAGVGFQRSNFRVSSMGIDNTNNMSFALQNSADSFSFRNASSDFAQTTSGTTLLTILSSGGISTGTVYSTNQTTTNIVATSSTITNLSVPGTLTVVNITSTNLVETNITAATIIITGGSLNATFNSNTIGSIFTTGGNVGINTLTPGAPLHITRNVGTNSVNPLLTLTALPGVDIGTSAIGGGSVNLEIGESGGNLTTFTAGKIIWGAIDSLYGGPGEANGLMIIQTANQRTLGNLLTLTGNQRVGINTTNPGFDLDVNGTVNAITYTGANLAITSATTGTMIANDSLSIGGISSFFTGSFSANNNVTSASNITGLLFPSASVRSFLATLTINVSKAGGNLNEMVTLEGIQRDSGWSLFDTSLGEDTGLVFTIDSTGQVKYTSINHLVWTSTTVRFEGHYYTIAGTYIPTALPTTGNVAITGDLSISSTKDATNTSSGALTVLGGAGVSKSLLVGQNLNVGGVSNTFTGSFAAANNVAAATNVTGFLVPTATFSSFTASVNVRLLTTTTTLNAQYLFEATQTTSGWLLNDTTLGDSVGITFTITSTGQIQYTSTNVANWQSTTINYSVTAISISTGFTAVLPTSGSVTISGNLTIDSTTDSSSTSAASLVLAGGAGINKSLLVGGNFNIGGVTTQFAGTFSAANGASGATFTGLSFPNATIRSFTCTISIRVVSSVNYNTQHTIDGIQTATGGWQISDSQIGDTSGITFAINSSGQITYTSPTFTTWTSTTMHYNAIAYNISSSYTPIPMPTGGSSSVAGSLVIQGTDEASSTSSGALSVSGGVNVQKNLIVADTFFVTSTGNVGIGTSSPQRSLHVASQWIRLSSPSGSSYGEFFVDSAAMTIFGKNSGNLILKCQGNWIDEGVFIQNTNGSVLLSALQSGNVGIATTAPAYTLDVNGTFEASNENGLILFASSGNVGIGTTAPSSRLTISSAAAQLAMYPTTNGSEASIAFFNNTVTSGNTTRWVVGNNAAVGVGNFGFWNSSLGAPVMGLTSTGNVGIGTTAPNSKLHVIGNINTTIGTYIGSGITTADTTGLHIPINNALVFMTNATERIRITGGNVGIGTSTPSYTLDINGSLRTTGPGGAGTNGSAFITGGDSYGHSLYIASSSGTQKRMGFNHNGTVGNIWAYDYGTLAVQNLILQYPGGNVGIGTAPGYKLEVLQDNTGAYPGDTTTGQIIISGATDSTKRFGFQLDTVRNFGHIQVVRAGDTAYPLILNGQGGNVGIGTTSPTVTLDVAGTIRAVNGTTSSVIINGDSTYGAMEMFGSNGAYIDFKNNSGDDYDSRIQFTGSNNSLNFYMSTGNTVGMSLTSAGTLLISGDIGAFASISDARLKTNVENITPDTALNTVKTLRPVTFNWRDDIFNQAHRGEFDSGFIAQEVEEVIPHAVGEYTTIDYQNTYKNMRHERIIPYLVGSIQKLEGIITELRNRIEYLESR